MIIKAILFDMGNTIIKYDVGSPEEVFQRVLASLGISRSVEEIMAALITTEQEAKDLSLLTLYGKMECEKYWQTWDSLVLKHLEITKNEELAKVIHARWFDHIDCTSYPEAKEVLLKLKQMGLKIGIITTAYEEEISLILKKANLEKKIFDIMVGADTIKKVKPHPDVFKYALRMLKTKPDETIFVGDSIDADYRGAQDVGLQAILLDRTEKKKAKGLRTIADLKEIFANIN